MPEAEMQSQSLYEFFEEFLDDVITHFPPLKSSLMIADGNEERVHTCLEGRARQQALDYLNDEEKGSYSFFSPGKSFAFIFINELVTEAERDYLSEEAKRRLYFVLDHELGHLCLKNGANDETLFDEVTSECVADAYALIRHYQRYGTDDYRHSHVDPFTRSRNLVMDDLGHGKSHFTVFVLDEIIKRKDMIGFDSLSHQQTVDLAWRFAMHYTPPLPVIEALCETFIPVKYKWSSEGTETAIKRLADITLNPENDYYTFRMGRLWLGRYIEDRALPDGTPIDLPKEYLDDVAKRLKEREFKLAQEDILFNVPIKSPRPQARPVRTPELAV